MNLLDPDLSAGALAAMIASVESAGDVKARGSLDLEAPYIPTRVRKVLSLSVGGSATFHERGLSLLVREAEQIHPARLHWVSGRTVTRIA